MPFRSETRSSAPIAHPASSSLISISAWASAAGSTMVTADHGSRATAPSAHAGCGLSAERIKKAAIKTAITAALNALRQGRLGAGRSRTRASTSTASSSRRGSSTPRLSRPLPVRAGHDATRVPGICDTHPASPRASCRRSPPLGPSHSFLRRVPGDVVLVQAPFSFWGKYGENKTSARRTAASIAMTPMYRSSSWAHRSPRAISARPKVDLAATLARLLGVNQPASCEGHPIGEILLAPVAASEASRAGTRLRRSD